MGITIEQYRARIGYHSVKNKTNIKYINGSPFLRGRYFNKILMLFHLYVFLVIMLSFEMMCYNVYVPLLLRLSNDVEENPGPSIYEIVNSNNTVRADFSQGYQAKFGENAGKQCVAMSLTAVIFKYITNIYNWDSADLNSILAHGNCLYNCIRVSVKHDFLLLTDVPNMVSLEGNIYSLTYSDSLFGELFMTNDSENYVTLKNAFDKLFFGVEINYEYCLLTIDCNTVAVFKTIGNCYKVFDSHARDLYGMPHSSGTAVLLTVESLDNLVTFFQKTTYGSTMPFEIIGVSIIDVAGINQHQNVDQCFPRPNKTDLSPGTSNQNCTNKMTLKRKAADAEPVLNKKNKRDKNEYDSKKIANEDEKKREKKLKACRLNYLKKKTNENESIREKRLAKRREVRQNESVECRKNRLEAMQAYNKKLKANETGEHKEKRLLAKRVFDKKTKENETGEHKEKRLFAKQAYNKKTKENETSEHREKHLLEKQMYNEESKANETVKHREKRLLAKQVYDKKTKENETGEQREKRLLAKQAYNKKTKENETVQHREKRLLQQQVYDRNETDYNKRANNNDNTNDADVISNLVHKFHIAVSKGPLYICTCCDQLWYRHSVNSAEKLRLSNPNMVKYLLNKLSVDNIEWICRTCEKYLKKNKMPPYAVKNGMLFPEKPEIFDLNELEWRLLAPRIAFQKLLQAPRGKQFKINGNVVNVPADVVNTVNTLPRLPNSTGTIKVQLKRRLQYKSSALSLNVRPHKVFQAAAWLTLNSALYQEQGILFNNDWQNEFLNNLHMNDDDMPQEIDDSENRNTDHDSSVDQNHQKCQNEAWSEDEAEIPAGVTDTMLTAPDFLEDHEREVIHNVAPGEGNRPLSIFRDKYSEELAYPGIFLGQKRPEDKERLMKVFYSDICKSELRRSDRRAAMCVENIFFKTKKLQMKILLGKSQIALRKNKRTNIGLTAGQLKQDGSLERIVHFDEGFKFLKALRGSPPYFEKAKKDIFAMIRQLGPATLFCSFSSAETKWLHLLRILGQLIDHKDYTNEELEELSWQEKCRLIQSDPVTCARHFDYQFNTFLKEFLMSSIAPLGKIKDWFYRVEYQQRGSPHIHMLIWLENAPVFGVDQDDDVTSFIDTIIMCHLPNNEPELLNLVNRQTHRHSHTCRKKSKKECRFNYPQPPMRSTKILYPLDDDVSDNDIKKLKVVWKTIKQQLNDMKEGENITFDQLLTNLNVSEHDYLLVIQSSLNCPTIFLKRNPNELRINNYNTACLTAWRANMDIQFVLDVYACAMYIVSYISKAQKGMSELLRVACAEAREGNASIKQQVRDIGNKFLNSVEISAQEAVYIVLQLPMRKSSRQVIFIPTSPPNERVQLLKPLSEIEKMPDECEEIHFGGLLKRYIERPVSVENVTLADWAAWYDNSSDKPNYQRKSTKLDIDGLPVETLDNDDNNDDELCDDVNTVTCNTKCKKSNKTNQPKKRTKPRIIRSVWFNKEEHPEKHYRELIMLFTPWRNEDTDLIGEYSSYREHYLELEETIQDQMSLYAVCYEELNNAQEQLNSATDDIDDQFDLIAPTTQHIEQQDEHEGTENLHPDLNENYDLSDDLGIPSASSNNEPLILNELPDQEYREMVQTLNKKQKEFFYHSLHQIRTCDKPFYSFLSGGAGVGKSHLTKSIYQAALKYYNTRAGDNFHEVKVLLLAPTGKAAFIIKGNTIHSALAIPACQSLKIYKPLDSNRLNTMRCLLGGLKLILLDEVSMVGNSMFNVQINNRLKDIKGSKEDFGGVSIIAIGDLFQLKPVMDGLVFKDFDNSDYGVLTPNLWNKHFRMLELDEIMRQRDSKVFAEILNRLREGKHTQGDILKIKERIVLEQNCPQQATHLFIQNSMVDEFNNQVHEAATGRKYTIKAQDNVIGANSAELRDKIMKQIPNDPRKTKQLASKLYVAEGERTEIAINVRTDDGLTNGASNIIKLVQLHQPDKPSGIIWVQFDQQDVGRKTRHENRQLYRQSNIEQTWTPIKPVTTQFAVGRNRSAQIVRKQFPLRPAAAKTVHRSQGDTQSEIVVNLNTRRAIPHIHYVALSRVTTIEGLYITDLCEDKIAVDHNVVNEMNKLRTETSLQLCISPLYNINDDSVFKLCYLNARSLHKHIEDIRNDFNYSSAHITIFTETRFRQSDPDEMYSLNGFQLFRNDSFSIANGGRPFGGTAVYSKVPFFPGYPYSHNINGIEFTFIKVIPHPNFTIVAVYRSPKIPISQLCSALREIVRETSSDESVIIGDFNVNWLSETDRNPLYNVMVRDNSYVQLISDFTTDNKTIIDHIYCKTTSQSVNSGILETYFTDHKTIWLSYK